MCYHYFTGTFYFASDIDIERSILQYGHDPLQKYFKCAATKEVLQIYYQYFTGTFYCASDIDIEHSILQYGHDPLHLQGVVSLTREIPTLKPVPTNACKDSKRTVKGFATMRPLV